MKKVLIMMMAVTLVGVMPLHAQDDDFFDEEIENLEDEIQPPDTEINDADPVEPESDLGTERKKKSRFSRPSTRNARARETPPPATPVNTGPSSPVKDIKVSQKKRGRKKIKFADAMPEDITNENFPDLIESFDYPNADIVDVAKAISKLTGKNFIFEPGVRGKISIVAPSKITVAEAWEAFLTSLAMNGFTIVPKGKFLSIRKVANAKNDSIEMYGNDYAPVADQLITRVLKLKYIDAEDTKKSLQNFVSKKAGDIAAYSKTNSLIISGFGSAIERIARIIKELDKPGFEERLEVIPIKNAKAKDISELIDKIINKDSKDKKNRFRSSRFNRDKQSKAEALSMVAPDERTNSLIVVGNQQGVKRIRKLVARLDYPLDPADAGGVYVYYVKHGEATKIAETLSGVAQETEKAAQKTSGGKKDDKDFQPPKKTKPLFGGNVVIKADENTNSLIITSNKQDYKIVKNLLNKIDIPKDQVFVEAVIMEMESSVSDVWNMNFMQFFPSDDSTGTTGQDGIARAGFTGGADKIGGLINPTGGQGAILNFGDPNSKKVSLNLGGQTVTIPSLIALISILKTKANGNILSTPNILAMDNEESEIVVGDEVPVGGTQNISGGAGVSTITPTFKDATIELKIKPFISPDSDMVRLNVEQKISKVSNKPIQASGLANITQALSKKSVKTNIVLESGQTAVLGGLMEDEDSVEESKVPLLGDIPILGWLFKNRTVRKTKKNLVVFLTPNIIRNTSDHKKILNEKLTERIDWIKKYNGGRDPYGARFNDIIKDSDSTAGMNFGPSNSDSDELELDVEEAQPVEDFESEEI